MAHIVSYSNITVATIPKDSWDECWYTMQSWKGYLQSFPGFKVVRLSARALDTDDVRFYVTTVWAYPEQLEEWRESQWSAVAMLKALRQPAYDIDSETLEDLG